MYTPVIFERFPEPADLAAASFEEVYELIKSISFPNNKAKHLIGMATKLVSDFGSVVPSEPDLLETLPGVGRKIANLIRGDVYGIPGIVVDTHCMRLSKRMGITKETEQHKIEKDLVRKIPKDYQTLFCHQLVEHGRKYCTARSPKCDVCILKDICRKRLK